MILQLPCCTCKGLFHPDSLRVSDLGDADRPLFECVSCIRKAFPYYEEFDSTDRNYYPSEEEAHR